MCFRPVVHHVTFSKYSVHFRWYGVTMWARGPSPAIVRCSSTAVSICTSLWISALLCYWNPVMYSHLHLSCIYCFEFFCYSFIGPLTLLWLSIFAALSVVDFSSSIHFACGIFAVVSATLTEPCPSSSYWNFLVPEACTVVTQYGIHM